MRLNQLICLPALLAMQAGMPSGLQDPAPAGVVVTTLPTSEPLVSQGRLGGISVAADGTVYVANFGATVWRVEKDGRVTALSRSLRGSSGNAIDAQGNLLQGSFLDNRVVRIAPDGTASDFVTQGLDGPVGIAVHPNGQVYVCNCRGNSLSRIEPDGAAQVFAQSEHFSCPNGVAVGPDGALYVVSYKNGVVVRVTLQGAVSLFATLPDGTNSHIAFAGGSFYVTKIATNKIYRMDQEGGSLEWFAGSGEANVVDGPARQAGLARANGIAAAPDGSALYLDTLEGKWQGDERTRIWIRRIQLPGQKKASAQSSPQIAKIQVSASGFVFDALAAGPENGELVLLLHGFPQTSYAFRHQLSALARSGYRAVAPDQRGYSPGARPLRVEDYAMGALVSDVTSIADALGRESFHLIGHDWGGAVAWVTAARHPSRVRSLVVLSTPHYAALGAALAKPDSEQSKRSSYFSVFGAEGAEENFLADDAAYLRSLYQSGGLTQDEIQVYVDALGTPEAMRAALNWYSALLQSRSQAAPPASGSPPAPRIRVPTLYIWSTEDAAFSRSAAEATRNYVSGPYRFEVLEGISHWVPEQAAQQVNEMILKHLEEAVR